MKTGRLILLQSMGGEDSERHFLWMKSLAAILHSGMPGYPQSAAMKMKAIVLALNLKNRGLTRNELLKKTGITDSGAFSKQLKALESGAFIMKYDSFENGKRDSFYKLSDPICIFYLKFVSGNSKRKKVNWDNIAGSQSVITWNGLAYENVCFVNGK